MFLNVQWGEEKKTNNKKINNNPPLCDPCRCARVLLRYLVWVDGSSAGSWMTQIYWSQEGSLIRQARSTKLKESKCERERLLVYYLVKPAVSL